MKTLIFSTIIAAALSVTGIHTASANNSVAAHSPVVNNIVKGEPNFKGSENFAKSFPEAMVKSYETKEGRTKVDFTWNGDALEAYYDLDGTLVATTHYMNTNNLPMSVKMAVSDNYKDYTIVQALEMYHAENGLSYYVMLKKDNKGLILQIAPQGTMSIVKRLKN